MLKSELKAEEYRARAHDAAMAAEATPLALRRERFEHAAATWNGLADAEDARTLRHRAPAAAQ